MRRMIPFTAGCDRNWFSPCFESLILVCLGCWLVTAELLEFCVGSMHYHLPVIWSTAALLLVNHDAGNRTFLDDLVSREDLESFWLFVVG